MRARQLALRLLFSPYSSLLTHLSLLISPLILLSSYQRFEAGGTDARRGAPPPPPAATPTAAAAPASIRAAAAAPKALEAAYEQAGVPYIISGASPGQPHGAPARLFSPLNKEAVCFALSGRALASTEPPPLPLTSGAPRASASLPLVPPRRWAPRVSASLGHEPRARASASLPHFRRYTNILGY
jgi:hypothetical protein